MNRRPTRNAGQPALDLIEDATALLRRAPFGVLLSYYVGSVPAIIGLLYFFADISRGAFARAHLIDAALGTGLLYLWMKCWHAVFANGLHATLAMTPPAPWTLARVARLVAVQAAIQPSGLFARTISAQLLVPYVWVYGFYQNVSVFGGGESADVREVMRLAAAQARLWPRQAHHALLLLFVFALFVAANCAIAVFLAPLMLKTFFGIETVFSRSPLALLNTTVFAAVCGLTYLVFDPLRKAVYVVRCFCGGSLRSGDDLRVGLRQIQLSAVKIGAVILLALVSASPRVTAAEAAPVQVVDSSQLDSSIERVLQHREYAWRLPREAAPNGEKSWLASFIDELFKSLGRTIRKAIETGVKFVDKLREWFGGHDSESAGPASGWDFSKSARPLLYAAIALLVAALGFILWRGRKNRRPVIAVAEAVEPVIDLRSEDVVADQLPEDGWLRLARELLQSGELRLALRASYLAGLAHLGQRELITIARHKSNLDYDRELRRRARPRQELVAAFEENMGAFESAWYGLHEVTLETLGGFNQNLDRIRAC